MSEYLEKFNRYTTLIAETRWKEGRRFSPWDHLRLPLNFANNYLLKLGFLDGQAGFTYALLSAFYSWMKFLKLTDFSPERKKKRVTG